MFFSVSFVFSVDPLFFIRVDSWFPIRVIRSQRPRRNRRSSSPMESLIQVGRPWLH